MKPSIWIYGGVHHDPGSRRRFIEELTKREKAPHFLAVEWERSVFERLAEWRPWVADNLNSHYDFLTGQDCHELSLALAWEGDAYTECFPGTDLLWLESGYQEADLARRFGMDTDKVPESFARSLLERLRDPCRPTMREWMTNTARAPEPRSRQDLIDRVWRKAWAEASGEPEGFERDVRWADAICKRSADLYDGWIAVVVGWVHADRATGTQRLHGLLLSKGFAINSVRLGP